MLKIPGRGTKKPEKEDNRISDEWKFESKEIADLVMNNLLSELRNESFYVQAMSKGKGYSHARKDDIDLFITEKNKSITITTDKTDMPFVKNELYEIILELSHNIEKLKTSANPVEMKKDLMDTEARATKDILALIDPECFVLDLKGKIKEDIIKELVDVLAAKGKLLDRNQVLADVLEREITMSTGMDHGIALPHAKTDGIAETSVVVGIKKEGIDFESMDGQPSQLFVLIVSPKKDCGLYVQFLAAVGAILRDKEIRETVINSDSPQDAVSLLKKLKS
jgi:mannitol/fructose-specific phosphotransferase system IIA component (Ntr-type)